MTLIGLGIFAAITAALAITTQVAFSGVLEPSAAPAPTMHTLEDIYTKLQTLGTTTEAILPSVGDTMGSSSIHMLVEEIEGNCTVQNREGTIPLLLFSHNLVTPRDAASGLPTGETQHEPVTVLKYLDKASPLLVQRLITGYVIPHVTVRFYRTNDIGHEPHEENYYTITLDNVKIVSVKSSVPHIEEIAFIYEHIIWRYETDGIEFEANWPGTHEEKTTGPAVESQAR